MAYILRDFDHYNMCIYSKDYKIVT